MHYFLHAEMLHLFLSVSSFDMLMFHGRVTYSVFLSSLQNEIGRPNIFLNPRTQKLHRISPTSFFRLRVHF